MSTFGKNINVSIFGESHGNVMGLTIHHFPAGIKIDEEKIKEKLTLRRGLSHISTSRIEEDNFEIVSGYFNGYTTGAPLTVLVYNNNTRSRDYDKTKDLARPSHADYVANQKYHGFNDYRGGGHFSGRITALIVILGSICEDALKSSKIKVISRVKSIGKVFDDSCLDLDKSVENEIFPVVDLTVKEEMMKVIEDCKKRGDSCGGILETHIYNVPVGIGEPFFDSCESIISHLVFSIPGVKGIEFGGGFDMCKSNGSLVNDQMIMDDNKVSYKSNFSGGINGGISNGNVITFKTAIKPTPSIYQEQHTINMKTKENTTLQIVGRHDPVIAIRALHVVNAISYYAILEMMMESRLWK